MFMMTLSNGNIFRVTGHLCGEFTGDKGRWREALIISLICAWTNGWVNDRSAGDLRSHCAHYHVTVMFTIQRPLIFVHKLYDFRKSTAEWSTISQGFAYSETRLWAQRVSQVFILTQIFYVWTVLLWTPVRRWILVLFLHVRLHLFIHLSHCVQYKKRNQKNAEGNILQDLKHEMNDQVTQLCSQYSIRWNERLNFIQSEGIFDQSQNDQSIQHRTKLQHWSWHYNDVIMSAMGSQITSLTIVYSAFYSGADQKKTSKLRVTGLCEGNSPVTDEFPAQRAASNAENVSIWWRHHGYTTTHGKQGFSKTCAG